MFHLTYQAIDSCYTNEYLLGICNYDTGFCDNASRRISRLFNTEDPENQGQDKVSYTTTFPGIEVQDNDPVHSMHNDR